MNKLILILFLLLMSCGSAVTSKSYPFKVTDIQTVWSANGVSMCAYYSKNNPSGWFRYYGIICECGLYTVGDIIFTDRQKRK